MAVESEEVHHESSEEYDSEEYEDDEEVLDTEHIDVEMEEDGFKTHGKERCKDAFLNFSSDYEDNEADEDNDLVDEDEEGFGSEEEIDDTAGANDLDLGDAVGAGFPIHDPSVKWNKMKPLLGERWLARHFLKELKPNLKCKEMQSIIRTKFHCGVSWSKAYRTRCRAMTIIDEKWESVVCPAAIKKMNKFGEDLRNWNVNPSGPFIFEARNGLEGYMVDLQSKVCSCRLWDISGIPCVHAQCAILFTVQDLVQFISGAKGNRGGKGSKRGGRGSKRGGRGSKTSVGIEGGGVAEVEGGGVENEDDTIPEKYLVHLWKAMQDLKLSGYSIEEIKNTLSLTDSHMKQLNDYSDTIEQVLPMSMEEEYPPQTETQDGAEEIIPETQPESEEDGMC
ncbi:unnamed protein product [Lactuca virosa]|uniref:SWIM-type domain-containing protein n=1 Tax=Lactuca virosa TaxID=75947 RepID=A0AAU9LNK3_9ASTR|nr:unnamed protein product [Lactuca virosa]